MFPVTHLYLMLYISVAVSPKSRTSIPYGTLSCSIFPPIPPLPLLPIHTYTPSHCLTIATLCYPLRRYSRLISKWHSHSHWAHTVHASPHCAHCTHRTLYTPHTAHCSYDTTHACCTHHPLRVLRVHNQVQFCIFGRSCISRRRKFFVLNKRNAPWLRKITVQPKEVLTAM